MGLRGAEDRHRAPRLVTVVVEIGVVVGAVVVETEGATQFGDADMTAVRLSVDGEIVDVDILLHGRCEQPLQAPYAGVVVGVVGDVVLGISRVEVELTGLGIPQSVLLGKRQQVLVGKVILRVVGVIVAETALVAGDEILVVGNAAGQPMVTAGVLEVPCFLVVDETDTEALGRTIFLNHSA